MFKCGALFRIFYSISQIFKKNTIINIALVLATILPIIYIIGYEINIETSIKILTYTLLLIIFTYISNGIKDKN